MSDVFISYARASERSAEAVAAALAALGHTVWRDDQLPAHRAYSEVIEERLRAARAVVVLWSADAVKSQWVRAEAEIAREAGTLAQASLDGTLPPLPFNLIQCADLTGWAGDADDSGWRKLAASVAELCGGPGPAGAPPPPRAAVRAPSPAKPSIAVMPFAAANGDADLADGVVEELVTALSRFPTLLVIASRTSLTYRGDARGADAIARELGVRFLLEGGVRRTGERVRVTLNLVDTESGGQVWSERFDRAGDDAFALQEAVAQAAAAQIAPAIDAIYLRRSLGRPAEELSAYELYLRSVHLERAFTREAMQEGIAAAMLAVEREPGFAPALAFGSLLWGLVLLNGWADDPAAATQQALELGRRAVTAGPDYPDVLATVSTVFIWVGEDASAADAIAERALALNPGASMPWFASAWIKVVDGRPALALEHWDRHMQLDPRSSLYAFVAGGRGMALTLMGEPAEAAARLQESLQMVPEQRLFRAFFAAALANAGRTAEAARELRKLPADVIGNTLALVRNEPHRAVVREGLRLAGAVNLEGSPQPQG